MVRDLIQEAGNLSTAKIVIFTASDGYTTSLPLEYFFTNDILLAYKMNGLVIPPERGFPFQLVAESKYGYKWIKWMTKIELSDNINYQGYWESRATQTTPTYLNTNEQVIQFSNDKGTTQKQNHSITPETLKSKITNS